VLVPASVRKLDRNDPRHVRWRILATAAATAASVLAYRYLFFDGEDDVDDRIIQRDESATTTAASVSSSAYSIALAVTISTTAVSRACKATGAVLAHASLLYFGPILQRIWFARWWWQRRNQQRRGSEESSSCSSSQAEASVADTLFSCYELYAKDSVSDLLSFCRFGGNVNKKRKTKSGDDDDDNNGGGGEYASGDEQRRWVAFRNLVVAPLTEEIVFRGCIVSALSESTDLSPTSVALAAPLFFGSAHLHHAALRLRNNEPIGVVAIGTAFQFAYTSLFGSYASYAYLRTKSIAAVVVSHAFW